MVWRLARPRARKKRLRKSTPRRRRRLLACPRACETRWILLLTPFEVKPLWRVLQADTHTYMPIRTDAQAYMLHPHIDIRTHVKQVHYVPVCRQCASCMP